MSRFSDWEQLYKNNEVEKMPWFFADLDIDFAEAIKKFNISSGKVLDLGTGPATQAIYLAKKGFDVTATDISASAIEKAKLRAGKEKVKVLFLQDDILETSIKDNFDLILDRGVFHVLPPARRVEYIANIKKLLKPEAFLLLKCFSYEQKGEGGPYRFKPKEIKDYFQNEFEVISISETDFNGTLNEKPKALICIIKNR